MVTIDIGYRQQKRTPLGASGANLENPVCKTWYRLLRKEVIQPHLPVQLPCYDLTPVTSHTLNTRPIGGATRLRVQLASMV